MMDRKKLKNKAEALDLCSTSSSQAKADNFNVQFRTSVYGRTVQKPLASNLEAAAESARKKQQRSSSIMSEKFAACSLPISSITIGSWTRFSSNIQPEMIAKIYYAKKRLVWEILIGNVKNKMEIPWSNITAIQALMALPRQNSILEIELSNPPQFFREKPSQLGTRTVWERSSDFTDDGQALIFRRHTVTFPPGKLDKPYEDLLKCDQNLLNLSMMPFPTHPPPRFEEVPPSPSPVVSDVSEEKTIVSKNQPQLHYPWRQVQR